MSFDAAKSGSYPIVSFNDQKFQTRTQRYALIVHAYLCLGVSFIIDPLFRLLGSLRQYLPGSNPLHASMITTPDNEDGISLMRPLYARIASRIHTSLMLVVNVIAFPFLWVYNLAISTSQFEDRLNATKQDTK